jgi:hypothetical protein
LDRIIYLQRVDDLKITIYRLGRRSSLETSGFVKERGGISYAKELGSDNREGYVSDSTTAKTVSFQRLQCPSISIRICNCI